MSGRRHRHHASVLTRTVVVVVCVLWCVPTVGALLTSVRPGDDANDSGWWTVFTSVHALRRLTLDDYRNALRIDGYGHAFANSVAVTLPATFLPLLIAAFAAYAITFMRMPGRTLIFGGIVVLIVVPNQATFLPLFKLYYALGIQGTFETVWLAQTAFSMPLAVFLFRNFFLTLPRHIVEAALVDGATHFQTFWRVVFPLSVPALASFAIFQFLYVWNDLLVALIFIGPGERSTLPMLLTGPINQGWEQLTAGGVITVFVPVTVFLVLQRYFVRGLTLAY